MSALLPSPLPRFDRTMLRAAGRLVPTDDRAEWSRSWEAELWCLRHRRDGRDVRSITSSSGAGKDLRALGSQIDLALGVICDAVWMRTDCWRQAYAGTAALCLVSLAGLCVVSFLIGVGIAGGWAALGPHLGGEFKRFLLAAPLVIFVSFATISRRRTELTGIDRAVHWLRRQMFFAAMMWLVLLLAFLLSVDLCEPIHRAQTGLADLLQIFFFVVLGLAGLRWAFHDLEERCEQCLRALASPARVGRPTHNLLEWSGTEQICKDGHGLLSVPEMESSWRQSSQWVERAELGSAASA